MTTLTSAGHARPAGAERQRFATAEAWLARLCTELRGALREAGRMDRRLSLHRLSRRLGHEEKHLTRTLAGRGKLRVREVFQVLVWAGVEPWRLFLLTFPTGGEAAERLLALPLPGPEAAAPTTLDHELPSTTALLDQLSGPLRPHTREQGPELWTERCRRLLRDHRQEAGLSLEALGAKAGFCSGEALRMVLSGKTALTFRHVFRLLGALGRRPDRFFFEVFDPQEGPVAPGVELAGLLDGRDAVLRQTLDALLAEFGDG